MSTEQTPNPPKGKTVMVIGSASIGSQLAIKKSIEAIIESEKKILIHAPKALEMPTVVKNEVSQRIDKPWDRKNYQQRNKKHKSKKRR